MKRVFVLLNAGHKQAEFKDIKLPKGKWKMIANNKAVNHIKGVKDKYKKLKGGKEFEVEMEPVSLKIWVKE